MRADNREHNLDRVGESKAVGLDGPIGMLQVKTSLLKRMFIYSTSKYTLIHMFEIWVLTCFQSVVITWNHESLLLIFFKFPF